MRDNRNEPRPVNGVHRDDARARAVPLDRQDVYDPVDLVAVQADDELINALSAGYPVSAPGLFGYDADDRVAAILAAWKAEVDEDPIPELVDVDQAVAAVLAGRPRKARARHLAPVAAAAAFLVLTLGGVSVTSHSAEPGDVLWPVSRVLFSERAESVEAAARVEDHIDRAKQALVSGKPTMAERELEQAHVDLAAVRPEEGQVELADVQDFLLAKAQETPEGVPADLDAPLASKPTRPVPAGVAADPDVAPLPSSALTKPPVTGSSGAPPSSTDVGTAPQLTTDDQVGSESNTTAPTRPTTSPPASDDPNPAVGEQPPSSAANPTTSTPTPPRTEGLGGGAPPPTPTT